MFKTKEELLKEPMGKEYHEGTHPYNIAINKAFKSFAERVEFYKKYTDDEESLFDEQEEIWKKWKKTSRVYNYWLFDYCFGDVIE